jgi:hypothetical protein
MEEQNQNSDLRLFTWMQEGVIGTVSWLALSFVLFYDSTLLERLFNVEFTEHFFILFVLLPIVIVWLSASWKRRQEILKKFKETDAITKYPIISLVVFLLLFIIILSVSNGSMVQSLELMALVFLSLFGLIFFMALVWLFIYILVHAANTAKNNIKKEK